MNKKMMAALGAFAVLGATPALAQESRPMNLSVKAGLMFPSSSEARDEASNFLQLGLEYKLSDLNPTTTSPDYRAYMSLAFDYFSGGDFSIAPLQLNYVGARNEWYYTAGAGVAFADINGSDTLFSWSLGIGYNFQQGKSPTFVEAKYFGTDQSEANGISVAVGVRF